MRSSHFFERVVRKRAFAAAVALAAIVGASAVVGAQTPQAGTADGLAAWNKIAAVLQHPRCLNCHQLEVPLQGDLRRIHTPRVERGADNHGVTAMRCTNCHNETGNNPTSGVPGALHWQLAPASMLWQGLSVPQLCEQLKDPKRNGNRNGAALVEHMETEGLILWSWNPGRGREPIPTPHREFVELMKLWTGAGMPCPAI